MEIKLKSGRKLAIKKITIDERDSLLDGVKYIMKDGKIDSIEMMHSTMTKWIRICVDGDTSDDALMDYSLDERIEVFTKLQDVILLGEKKASK